MGEKHEKHEKHEKLELRAPLTVTWPLLEVPKATRVRASDPPNWAFRDGFKNYIFLNEKIVVKKLSSLQRVLYSKVRCCTTATVAFRGLVNFEGLSAILLDLGSPGNIQPRNQRLFVAPRATRQPSQCRSMHLNRLSCTASRKCTLGNIIKLSQPIHTFIKPRLNSQHSYRKLPWSALSCRGHIRGMAPRPELEKQYMSSGSKPKKSVAEPRPSAS